jgi:hypothetical protein
MGRTHTIFLGCLSLGSYTLSEITKTANPTGPPRCIFWRRRSMRNQASKFDIKEEEALTGVDHPQ